MNVLGPNGPLSLRQGRGFFLRFTQALTVSGFTP